MQRTTSVACLIAFALLMVRGAQETETLPEDAEAITANAATSPEGAEAVSEDAQAIETEETERTTPEEKIIPSGITIDFPFPTTRDDDLASDYYADLEVFSDGSQSGLLFISDYRTINEGKLFVNEVVEIPAYDDNFAKRGIHIGNMGLSG